jgi:hypothetical protein
LIGVERRRSNNVNYTVPTGLMPRADKVIELSPCPLLAQNAGF